MFHVISCRYSFFLKKRNLLLILQEVRESRRQQEQRIVEVDSGVRQDYEFKLAQALQVSNRRVPLMKLDGVLLWS